MVQRAVVAIAALLFLAESALTAHAGQLTVCSAGVTTCSNDTTNDAGLVAALGDSGTAIRVWYLWNQQCVNIFSEAASTAGHVFRNNFCLAIAAKRVPMDMLVSMVMNSTVAGEILAGPASGSAGFISAAGNMVDADINTAIGAALTVNSATASTTATASSGSNCLTVASGTGIVYGQSAFAAGVPPGATVGYVSGTTVCLSGVTTAALSATPIAFSLYTGLSTRQW